MTDVAATVLFEHPLNEKMRTWLRIEFLLQQMHSNAQITSIASALLFFRTVSDLLDVLERGEVRTDLLKELERQQQKLSQWNTQTLADQSNQAIFLQRLSDAWGFHQHGGALFELATQAVNS